MPRNANIFLHTLLVPWVLSVCTFAEASCLRYEPQTVVLTGRLDVKTYPGPPNYEDIQQGDQPETGYYLKLSSPICTFAEKDEEASSHSKVAIVQLVLTPQQYSRLKGSLGKQVRLSGTLFEAFTGHHHTPVLLTVQRIENGS